MSIPTRTTPRGVTLTELGLGAAQLGNLYRETSEVEARETVATAWAGGIRYFDTAPHYGLGLSERRLGSMLGEHPREEVMVSTKVGRLLVPDPASSAQQDDGFAVPASHVRVWDFSRDGIRRSVEESLDRSGLGRFDILYLHDPEDHFEQASTEGIDALIELREEGVVGAVGAGMNFAEPLAELIRRADVDIVMCAGRFSLLDDTALAELLPLALERGVGVVAAGVYNSGLLSRPRPASDALFNYLPAPPALLDRTHRIADVCDDFGVSLPAAAIAHVLRHPAVTSVVLGMRGRSQVQDALDRYRTPVPDGLWTELSSRGLIAF